MKLLRRRLTLAVAFGALAWAGQAGATSITTITNLSGFGDPLQAIQIELLFGITTRFAQFAEGQIDFAEVENLPALGPIFNARACGGCHFQPALGGSGGSINELRIRNSAVTRFKLKIVSRMISPHGPTSRDRLISGAQPP